MASQEHVLRARLATEYRRGAPDPDRIRDIRRRLAAAQVEGHITRILSAAPPLNDDEREHLAALVLGGADAAAA